MITQEEGRRHASGSPTCCFQKQMSQGSFELHQHEALQVLQVSELARWITTTTRGWWQWLYHFEDGTIVVVLHIVVAKLCAMVRPRWKEGTWTSFLLLSLEFWLKPLDPTPNDLRRSEYHFLILLDIERLGEAHFIESLMEINCICWLGIAPEISTFPNLIFRFPN